MTSLIFLQFLVDVMFLTLVLLHLTKKNFIAVIAFGVQSLMLAMLFFVSFLETGNRYILLMVFFTFAIKVVLAPLFFIRLIRKYQLYFSVNTYLSMPATLGIIAGLTFMAHSARFVPLTQIVPEHQMLLSLALSLIFIALFLIINRKEAISQILSVLALENSIVVFIIFAGLEQSPNLQIGILFNIFVWIVIATVFVSMIYKHFWSHDVTVMKNLTD
ncbi:hypothetical protein A2592_01695 [Candidatus Kaiserbacteria bacterium RIFOXYD1_FULL_42_15]|uniref:Uncharacterized protein n=1 Tax=Candidatus Kaiserbacteria bacterium RIFOXYD1_FULL_42_15 TaxID=1798532 RepID=A0A1F6FSZ5_9BACT|nr:MAG: hypothetical protein A2592_01695 [Candidatus Kaiserbacteria bacterium RIFOXYD1_FULL_42_15]